MALTIQFGLYLLLMLGVGYYSMRRTIMKTSLLADDPWGRLHQPSVPVHRI